MKAVVHAASTSLAAVTAPVLTVSLADVSAIVSIIVGLSSAVFIWHQIIKLRAELRRMKKEHEHADRNPSP